MLLLLLACGWREPDPFELTALRVPPADHAFGVPAHLFVTPVPRADLTDRACLGTPLDQLTFAALDLRQDGISFAGKEVEVDIAAGVVRDVDRRGQLVAPLYDALLEGAEAAKDYGGRGCFPAGQTSYDFDGRLLLSVDRRVPMATVQQVVFTAEQAQYAHLYLRVADPSPDARKPAVRGDPATPAIFVGLGPHAATITTPNEEPEGIGIDYLPGPLAGVSSPISWSPEPDLPFQRFVQALDAVVGQQPDPGHMVLAHAAAPASPVSSAPAADEQPTPMPDVLSVHTLLQVPVRRAPPPKPPPDDPLPPGNMPPAMAKVVKRYGNQLRYCYQRELTKNPQLAGQVAVRFTVSPTGSVEDVALVSSELPEVEGCVMGRFRRMRFPEGAEGSYEHTMDFAPQD